MKIQLLQKAMREEGCDCTLFVVDEQFEPNVTYFSGLSKITHAAVVIPAAGKPMLYCSPLDYGRAKKESRIGVELLKKPLLKTIRSEFAPKKIGISSRSLSHHFFTKMLEVLKVKTVDMTDHISTLRVTKTQEEIELISKAASIANEAFTETMRNFAYKTESELQAQLEYQMTIRGASPSFPTIVASGKNAAVPHHFTTRENIQDGFCVIDFGANYKGYCSDCTRTIFVGTPSEKETVLYNRVRESQEAAIDKLASGEKAWTIDATARNKLGAWKKYFVHSLGHGIGVEVHESPSLSPKSREIIKMGMAVTIEPGVYIPQKLGIRIEDLFIIGKRIQCITKLPKELHRIQKKTV